MRANIHWTLIAAAFGLSYTEPSSVQAQDPVAVSTANGGPAGSGKLEYTISWTTAAPNNIIRHTVFEMSAPSHIPRGVGSISYNAVGSSNYTVLFFGVTGTYYFVEAELSRGGITVAQTVSVPIAAP